MPQESGVANDQELGAGVVVHFLAMNTRMQLLLLGTRWRTFSGVLLLVFLLRAIIPVGYMPDASAQPGRLGMTLCIKGLSANVIKILDLDKSHAHAEPQMLDCAFGSAVGQAALPFAGAVLFVTAASDNVRPITWRVAIHAFQLAVRGPPLGSRAPPAVFP